jgi:hypothetical protein
MKAAIHQIVALLPEARKKYAITADHWKALKAPTLVRWTDHIPIAAVQVSREWLFPFPDRNRRSQGLRPLAPVRRR